MKKIALYTVAIAGTFLGGCTTLRTPEYSQLNEDNIHIGMSKEDVIKKIGKPYKEEFYHNDTINKNVQNLFYKEILAQKYSLYIINSTLRFEDGQLVSLRQINEFPQNWIDGRPPVPVPANTKVKE